MCFAVFIACKGKQKSTKTETKKPDEVKTNTKVLSTKTGIPEKEMTNKKLYKFIDEWYGVPYKFGGCTKSGVDCSCFTNQLFKEVFNQTLARSSRDIYKESEKIKTQALKEGDFVFFKINSQEVSHVGVFLTNSKFVHASTSKGVMVSDLNDAYYKKYYFGAGRTK